MIQNNHSFYLFGGGFLTGLKSRLEELGTVAGELQGVSPFSQFRACGGQLKRWLPELDEALAQSQAEYLVLDLQTARQKLLVSGGCYVSAAAKALTALKRTELASVDPHLLPQEQTEKAISELAAVIRKHFAPERIILLHTNLADFWMAGNNYRPHQPAMFSGFQKRWMANLERLFRDQTGCRYVDVSRFYFLKKEPGRPLTEMIFEDACYEDVAGRIAHILNGGDGSAQRPDFALSLERYVAYHFTMQRKPQRVFLKADHFLDSLILSAQPGFVTENRETLIELDALDWNRPEKALALLRKMAPDATLTKICVAFNAVCNGRYDEQGVDYGLMFRSGVAPDPLIAYLKKEYAPKAGLQPGQINQYNAGCHFARMRKLDPAEFSTELTVEKPTLVDVFGSCISRTLFNVQDNDFAVNRYWFHVPPFEYRNKPVDCPPELFPEKINWTDRLVKLQFECGIYQDIKKSEAEWLTLDLYSLISPNTCLYQDCLFGDFDHRISNALKAQRVDLWRTPNLIAKDHKELLAALDPFLEVLRKKYGNRIILVDGQRQDHWLGDDGQIYAQPRTSSDCNDFMDRAFRYVQEKLGCYGIRIGQYFLPDELGYMRNTPAHKEDLGYFAAHDAIRYIVDQRPKEKLVTQYSGQIHMKHLLRLLEHNSPETLAAALPLTELDQAVVRLDRDTLERLTDALAELYDRCDWSCSLREILKDAQVDAALAGALKKTNASLKAQPPQKTDYDVYPSESPFLTGGQGRHGFPALPNLKVRRVINDQNSVAISWAAVADTCVRIYRKTGNGAWTLIGKSKEGRFLDRSVAPDTEYRYSLCVELEKNGKCCLGRFTPAVAIRTALSTPELLSAVHFEGINTLTWAQVPGAEFYWIYCKSSADEKWTRCAVISGGKNTCYSEKSKLPNGGEWYTVRALRTVDGKAVASGFQTGLSAAAL